MRTDQVSSQPHHTALNPQPLPPDAAALQRLDATLNTGPSVANPAAGHAYVSVEDSVAVPSVVGSLRGIGWANDYHTGDGYGYI